MIKAFIVDDHPLVREGLRQILHRPLADMVITGEGGYGKDTLKKIAKNSYDLIILVTYLSGMAELDYLKDIKKIKPKIPVLVLDMMSRKNHGFHFLKAGASGCLAKQCEANELTKAVRAVLEGKKYISPSLAENIALDRLNETEKLQHEKLSKREFEVMHLIASGKASKEIAKALSLSVKTISVHRANIMKKLKLRNNVELTCYVIENGLLD